MASPLGENTFTYKMKDHDIYCMRTFGDLSISEHSELYPHKPSSSGQGQADATASPLPYGIFRDELLGVKSSLESLMGQVLNVLLSRRCPSSSSGGKPDFWRRRRRKMIRRECFREVCTDDIHTKYYMFGYTHKRDRRIVFDTRQRRQEAPDC
jgi:hypothetical protein